MKTKIKDGKLKIEADLEKNPQLSKTGKSWIHFSTHGYQEAKDDKGDTYGISINLVKKVTR